MTDLILFENIPLSKQGIKSLALKVVETVKDGNCDPLEIAVKLKAMEDFIKELRGNLDIKDMSLAEAMKYGKSFDFKGSKIEVAELGVSYDFSVCDDEEYNNRVAQLELLKEQIKSRELFLKSLKEPFASETTQGCFINPPVKKGSLGIKITLK